MVFSDGIWDYDNFDFWPCDGKIHFSNANPGAWKLFLRFGNNFMAKVGTNAVNFAIAENLRWLVNFWHLRATLMVMAILRNLIIIVIIIKPVLKIHLSSYHSIRRPWTCPAIHTWSRWPAWSWTGSQSDLWSGRPGPANEEFQAIKYCSLTLQ